LAFTYTNGNTSLENPTAPVKPASGAITLVAGDNGVKTTTGGAFTLYKRTATGYDAAATLQASCSSGCSYTASNTVSLTVNAGAVHHIYLHNTNTGTPTPTASSLYSGTIPNVTANNTPTFYSWGYDLYGNVIGLQSVTWTKGSVTNASLSSTSGTSTTLTPGNYAANSLGTETLTASMASPASTVTLNIPIVEGPTSKFVVSAPSSVTASTGFAITVNAQDVRSNPTLAYTGSKTLAYSWAGATSTTGGWPGNCSPTAPSTTQTFTSGVASVSGFIAVNTANVFTVQVTQGTITGTSGNISVVPGSGSALYLSLPGGTTVTAANAFNAQVQVRDACSNTVSAGTGSLNFAFSGANSSLENVTAPLVPGNGSVSLSSGSVTTGNVFALYRRTGTNYDTTPTLQATCNSCSFTASNTVSLTVNPGANHHFYLQSSSANYPLPSSALSGTLSALLADNGNSKTYYAWGYDLYGNATGTISATWAKGTGTNGTLSASSGTSTTLTPGNYSVSPPSTGNETITATVAGMSPSSVSVTQPISPGAAKSFAVSYPNGSAVTSGVGFPITITAKDYYGNVATSYTGGAVTLSWAGSSLRPIRGSATYDPMIMGSTRSTHSPTLSFTSGVYTSGSTDFVLYSSQASGAYVSASASGITAGNGPTLTVTPLVASDMMQDATPPTLTAGSAGNVNVYLVDSYGNYTSQGCTGASLSVACTVAGACTSFDTGNYGVTNGAKAPSFTPGSLVSPGTYTVSATMYKASASTVGGVTGNSVTFTANCTTPVSKAFTMAVNANGTVNGFLLTQTANTLPGPTDHVGTLTCTSSGGSVSCPSLHSYSYDAYGNFNGSGTSSSCPQWSYSDGNSAPFNVSPYNTVSGLNSTGTSSGSISSSYHIKGSISCKVSGVSKGTTNINTQVVGRPYTWSCGAWSCPAGTSGQPQQSTCTLNNTSGYDFSGVSLTLPSGTVLSNGCTSGVNGILPGGGSCTVVVQGVSGSGLSGIGVASTVSSVNSQNTLATVTNPASVSVSGGALATTCP